MAESADDLAFGLVNGFRAANLVRTAALLRIPDLLAGGPRSADDLADQTGLLAAPLRRVLRALSALGVLAEADDGQFALTAVGDRFRDFPGSARIGAIMLPAEGQVAFAELVHTLRTGQTGYQKAFGMTRWDNLAADPEGAAVFNRMMLEASEVIAPALVANFDFSGCRSITDVGGGNGALLAGVLAALPAARGTLFDLPAGLAGAEEYLTSRGVRDSCEIVAGSFFEYVPAGSDAYLMKWILHDWPDDDCLRILGCCRQAMPESAALLIVERLLPDRATPADLRPFMADMQMLAVLGGRERTRDEFGALLTSTGFRIQDERPLDAWFHLIEARPA